jgi:hypothetical protein
MLVPFLLSVEELPAQPPSASVLPPAMHRETGALQGHIWTKDETKQPVANLDKDSLECVWSGDSGDKEGEIRMHLILPDYGKDMLVKRHCALNFFFLEE